MTQVVHSSVKFALSAGGSERKCIRGKKEKRLPRRTGKGIFRMPCRLKLSDKKTTEVLR